MTRSFLLVAALALAVPACTSEAYVGGECVSTETCRAEENYAGGTVCDNRGVCVCPNEAETVCCPDGADRPSCSKEEYKCRARLECSGLKNVPLCPNEDETVCCPDGAPPPSCSTEEFKCRSRIECAGLKDVPPAAVEPECKQDSDCPQPDIRCGAGKCTDGECVLDIPNASKPIPNQVPGDCKTTICDLWGEPLVWTDPSDQPLDGNSCTLDLCDGDVRDVKPFPDEMPCPDKDFGVCITGECLECNESAGIDSCPPGLLCQWIKCVPAHCTNGQPDVALGETDVNCGGACAPCYTAQFCDTGDDCQSRVCVGGQCQASTHTDGVKNDGETGTDCGWAGGPPHLCKDEQGCHTSDDCESSVCYLGACQVPACTDATQNGKETGVDCGGNCLPCASK